MASLPPPPVYSNLVLWLKLYGDLLDHFLFAEKETLVIGYFVLLPSHSPSWPTCATVLLGALFGWRPPLSHMEIQKKWYVNEH